jgi:hypothetical protein
MTHQIITVIIPPEMSDYDDCYTEVTEYVAACTGFNCIPGGDLHSCDRISCDAYFEDDKGNIWHGQLDDLPYPDGSQKYIVGLEKKTGGQ